MLKVPSEFVSEILITTLGSKIFKGWVADRPLAMTLRMGLSAARRTPPFFKPITRCLDRFRSCPWPIVFPCRPAWWPEVFLAAGVLDQKDQVQAAANSTRGIRDWFGARE